MLRNIADIIIVIGAVLGAIGVIYKNLAKPASYFTKKASAAHQALMKEVIVTEIPEIMTEMGKEYVKLMAKHDKELECLREETEILKEIVRNDLRQTVVRLYYERKEEKFLYYYELEALKLIEKNYESLDGNTFAAELIRRMKEWRVVADPYEVSKNGE